MKPRIRKIARGLWRCSDEDASGIGASPARAFHWWAQKKAILIVIRTL